MTDTESKEFDMLYPDLIPKRELISILKQRYIKTESLELLDKEQLVDLYNEYILPLPQRKYRVNRRGQQMTKKQVISAKKRKLEADSKSEDEPKNKRKSTGNLITSFELPSSGSVDRLKPPPSCINLDNKKIKLNNSSKSSDSVSSSLDRLKINSKNSGQDGNSSNKRIKLSSSKSSHDTSSDSRNSNAEKNLEINHTSQGSESTVEEKQKKIKKISWP